jgi:hypothetical protein
MKRLFGAIFMIVGAIFLYLFVARAMHGARGEMSAAFDPNLPFFGLGHEYPSTVLLFMGAIWGFLLGLGLILQPAEAAPGGRVGRVMLLNALLLLSSLFVAYVGGKSGADAAVVAVFGIVALAQAALGFFLLVFALFEKPKGITSILLGLPLYIGGVAIGLYTLLVLGKGGP